MSDTLKPNPYDYINEVTDPDQFAGREEELTIIEEEISRLSRANPIIPILALIGERRVGKTSLLLRVREMCDESNTLAALVSLTDSTAADPWEFWREVFGEIIRVSVRNGVIDPRPGENGELGLLRDRSEPVVSDVPGLDAFQFNSIYFSRSSFPVLPSNIVYEDLTFLCQCAVNRGFNGIFLIIDEAHLLSQSREIQQQLRYAKREAGRVGILFGGEPSLSRLFNDPTAPLYAQAKVIPLSNFVDAQEVTECILLPLDESEVPLVSPISVEHISRLSEGKPNQIRLLCNSVYERYSKGEQPDLSIGIECLENVVDNIQSAYSNESELRPTIEAIRRLDSVKLEILYNMTRYPGWSVDKTVEIDESFRGETQSPLAIQRRKTALENYKNDFINLGILDPDPDKLTLSGGEFVHLYLRFLFEIRKFGAPLRKLEIGRTPPTPFGEKTEKLVQSLVWELRRNPEIVFLTRTRGDSGRGNVISQVRQRFSDLRKLLEVGVTAIGDLGNTVYECFHICELVRKPGPYHLLVLSIRDLESARDSYVAEIYFKGDEPLVVPIQATDLIRRQADHCRVWLEEFDHFGVELTDLSGLLDALGGPSLEELESNLDMVGRWRIASLQHILQARQEEQESNADEESTEDVKDWRKLYSDGQAQEAEEVLNEAIAQYTDEHRAAQLYNDRGYIRHSLGKIDQAKQDLQRALDLHHVHLPLTLLDLAVIDIDEENYSSATRRIGDTLLLCFTRRDTDVGFLKTRLPANHLGIATREKWEQHPANILEAAYMNLAYVLFKNVGSSEAIDVLQESLELLPSSVRLKHGLARFNLARHRADLAEGTFKELADTPIEDPGIADEVRQYLRRFGVRGSTSRRNRRSGTR